MTAIGEIVDLIDEQGKSYAKQIERISALEKASAEIEKKLGRPNLGGGELPDNTTPQIDQFYDTKSKRSVPVYGHGQSMAETKAGTTPSLGRVLRGIVLGSRADDANELAEERKALAINSDPLGGYNVQGALSSEWIDLLRSDMVLSKAGCRTISMDSNELRLAKIVSDPTVSWHAENGALTDSDVTFGAINLRSKTVACLVKLSLELSQDAGNIEQILQTTITRAMSAAIDQAGLVGVSTDASGAPGGVFGLAGRGTVTAIGAPTSWDYVVDGMYQLMLSNVPMERIGGLVAHPAVFKTMRKLKTGISSDKTSLVAPPEVQALPKYFTTSAPLVSTTASAVIADWRDLLFGVRKDIQVRVLQEAFLGSNLQIGVLAYARVDFAATRAASFCTMEGITTS